jgi:hypothetical protein
MTATLWLGNCSVLGLSDAAESAVWLPHIFLGLPEPIAESLFEIKGLYRFFRC